MRPPISGSLAGSLFGLLLCLCLALPAQAHSQAVNTGSLKLSGTKATLLLCLPVSSLQNAELKPDRNGDGRLNKAEIAQERHALNRLLDEHLQLTASSGEVGQVGLEDLILPGNQDPQVLQTGRSQLYVLRQYHWSHPPQGLKLHYQALSGLFSDTPILLTAVRQGPSESAPQVETLALSPQQEIYPLLGPAKVSGWPNGQNWQSLRSFVQMGSEHVLQGLDHLLFLLALILVSGSSLGYLVKMVSAFTLAHSLTLILTVSGVLNLPSPLVESLIALSITVVALDNLRHHFQRNPQAPHGRWWVVMGFGLLHGMGFAAVLKEQALPNGQFWPSLLGFNLGVELGQLVFVLSAVWLLSAFKSRPRLDLQVRTWSSGAVALVGTLWFIERLWIF